MCPYLIDPVFTTFNFQFSCFQLYGIQIIVFTHKIYNIWSWGWAENLTSILKCDKITNCDSNIFLNEILHITNKHP